jgi:hypothetical protein
MASPTMLFADFIQRSFFSFPACPDFWVSGCFNHFLRVVRIVRVGETSYYSRFGDSGELV